MSRVASGLLSTVRVMGALPIIRYICAHLWCAGGCSGCVLVVDVFFFDGAMAASRVQTLPHLSQCPTFRHTHRCAPGGASEMLAQELNSLLKENISSRGPAQALFEVRREMTSMCFVFSCCRAR
jgi:hypothetical protein